MPKRRVVVVVDKCLIDGLSHEIMLSLDTIRVQGLLPNESSPLQVEREVVLTCPTTGRSFLATLQIPQPEGELIASIVQASS